MKTRKGTKVVYKFARRTTADDEATTEEKLPPDGAAQAAPVAPPTVLPMVSQETGQQRAVAAPYKPAEAEALPVERASLAALLEAVGVSAAVAQDMCASFMPEQVRLQLLCLPDRDPKNPAATLVSAIRDGWGPPPKYLERSEHAQHEEGTRATSAQRQSDKATRDEMRSAARSRLTRTRRVRFWKPCGSASTMRRARTSTDRPRSAWESWDRADGLQPPWRPCAGRCSRQPKPPPTKSAPPRERPGTVNSASRRRPAIERAGLKYLGRFYAASALPGSTRRHSAG